jgi:glycosyltransferase involved in cell wall biosynthesis
MQKNLSRPMFSVVIPTYNRAEYLRFTLETCCEQTHPSVEFIIQDDNSTDHTAEVAEFYTRTDARFRYCNVGQNVGMRGNFENSLNQTNGEYLIFLGGDDALIPDALNDLAEIVSRHPLKIITWAVPAYHYDEVRKGMGQVIASHSIFRAPFEVELLSKHYFEYQSQALFYVSDEKSPMLYVKSLVPRKIIDEVQTRSKGIFFSSSTPDGYSGFALASVVESYVYTNKPFSMHGVSPTSAGLNYVSGSNDKNDHSSKFFKDNRSVPMAQQLGSEPYSPLISLMTADFIFQTDNIFHHGFSKLIEVENLIRIAMSEMCNGLYSAAKISREMKIVYNIAVFYDKVAYFKKQAFKLRRNERSTLTGDMISPNMIYMSAPDRNISNVHQASHFIFDNRNRKAVYRKMRWVEAVYNSIKYKLTSYRLREPLCDHFDFENMK